MGQPIKARSMSKKLRREEWWMKDWQLWEREERDCEDRVWGWTGREERPRDGSAWEGR